MNYVFSPGCALYLYKPQLAHKIWEFLCANVAEMDLFLTCCHYDDHLPQDTRIINVCPGCNRRFKTKREGLSTITLWEIIADSNTFDFPDYAGAQMTILDACPTRGEASVHVSIRKILHRMNITLMEPQHTMSHQKCCGDSFYPALPITEVNEKMKQCATEMTAENVCVYCVSCAKSMHIGGKTPRYLVDLLFGEPTTPGTYKTDLWHTELEAFRKSTLLT